MEYHPINKTLHAESSNLDDLMCTALEGGITHWCNEAVPLDEKDVHRHLGEWGHEQITRGGSLRLHDFVENKYYYLTLEKLLKGIDLFTARGVYNTYPTTEGTTCIDVANLDGEAADIIVQFAVLGDVVYG